MVNPKDKIAVTSEGGGTGMGFGEDTQRISMVTVFSLNWVGGTQVFTVLLFVVLYPFYK